MLAGTILQGYIIWGRKNIPRQQYFYSAGVDKEGKTYEEISHFIFL